MKKITIISLGWLGSALYNKLKPEFAVLGTYFSETKKVNNQLQFDINSEFIPSEILQSDIIIICLPPSKIKSDDQFCQFLTQFKHKKLIFISSTSVYGMQGHVNELTSPIPETLNGKRLLLWENYIRENCDDYQIIRSAGQYGPGRHPGRFLTGKKNISGIDQSINLISQEDLIILIVKCLNNKESKTINAVSTEHLNKKEYYVDYCKRHELETPEFSSESHGLDKVVDTLYPEYRVTTSLT